MRNMMKYDNNSPSDPDLIQTAIITGKLTSKLTHLHMETGRVGRICAKFPSLRYQPRPRRSATLHGSAQRAARNAQRARGRHGVRAVVARAATAALGVATMLGDDVLPGLRQPRRHYRFPGRILGANVGNL